MSNVKTLYAEALTPEVLIQKVHESVKDLKELYVVGIDTDGKHICWASHDMSSIYKAAFVLQDLANCHLHDLIFTENCGGHDDPPGAA